MILCGLCTLDSLTQIGRTLRNVSQRPKIVLFIGTYVRSFEAMAPTLPVVIPGRITPGWATMPGMERPARLRNARRAFERATAEANVTVHVLDPVGIDSEPGTPLGAGSDVRDATPRNQTGSLAPAEFANHRTANVRMPLPTNELPPGQYLLSFEASAGDLRTERQLRFEIRCLEGPSKYNPARAGRGDFSGSAAGSDQQE